jgi:ketosteroid isomerase-like protein
MKYLHLFLFFFFFQNISFAQKNDILKAEKARFEACTHQDTLALAQLLSDDLVYIHSNSLKETKADFIHSVASEKIKYLKFEIIEQKQTKLSRKIAMIQGLVLVNGKFKGDLFEMKLRYTSIYIKKNHAWKLLTWQSTKLVL